MKPGTKGCHARPGRVGRGIPSRFFLPAFLILLIAGFWASVLTGFLERRLPVNFFSSTSPLFPPPPPDPPVEQIAAAMDGGRALALAGKIVGFGERHPGSPAHRATLDLLKDEIERAGWRTQIEAFEDPSAGDIEFRNLIARHSPRERRPDHGKKEILLLARYDSPKVPFAVMPAAMDSAAGPALLAAVAQALSAAPGLASRVLICFVDGSSPMRQFDAIDGLRGSRALAASLNRFLPGGVLAVIVVHGVGGTSGRLTIPSRSSPALARALELAVQDHGLPLSIERMERPAWDDDLPFLAPGQRVLLLHDGDSPQTGTADDTVGNLSAETFAATGRALIFLIAGLQTSS